jgi:hypothetical protein
MLRQFRKFISNLFTKAYITKVLHGVREERNVLHTVKRRKANWIGNILPRNMSMKEK